MKLLEPNVFPISGYRTSVMGYYYFTLGVRSKKQMQRTKGFRENMVRARMVRNI